MVIYFIAFAIAFLVLWFYDRYRIDCVQRQKFFYDLFARGVREIRKRDDIPLVITEFIEYLVKVPVDSHLIRKSVAQAFLGGARRPLADVEKEVTRLYEAIANLEYSARQSTINLIAAHITAVSYVDPISGYIFRRLLTRNLTRKAQADIGIEVLASQHSGAF